MAYESGLENLINAKKEAQKRECPKCSNKDVKVIESKTTHYICNNKDCKIVLF